MELIAAYLIAHGCMTWNHPRTGETRIYLNRFSWDLLEIEATFYKSGSISSYSRYGEKGSNNRGYRVISTLKKAYFNPKTGKFVCDNFHNLGEILSEELMEAVTERIKSENFQAAA